MAGLLVFTSLKAALDAGFTVYDRTHDGYLVRKQTSAGWAMALVQMRNTPDLPVKPNVENLDVRSIPKSREEFR